MSQFDVFLAHNSSDKPLVREIARKLERRGLKPWLDEEQIPPGRSFQDEIQQAIPVVKSAAIFIGSQGLGRWQNLELKTFISKCVEEKIPVIPVLLSGVNVFPEELIFLREFRYISSSGQTGEEEVLDLLEWGITGKKPQKDLQLNHEKPGQVPTEKNSSKISDIELKKFDFEIKTLEIGKGKTIYIICRSNQAEYFTEDMGNGITLEMVSIPGGKFLMGSPQNEGEHDDDEIPQHEVTVSSFLIGKYPITQAQWRAVATLEQVNHELNLNPSNFKGDHLPVERVSWYEAIEFCDRLSKYTNRYYRLASEAEWEYACRARTVTPFHFGKKITLNMANYHDSNDTKGVCPDKTTPVGNFKLANSFGLYDMHGNVLEWCLDDWHDNYEGAPTNGIPWFNEKTSFSQKHGYAVVRGGSWMINARDCRSASRSRRNRTESGNAEGNIGFRIVCEIGKFF